MAKVRHINDAKTLNKIVNLPEIAPFVAPGYEDIDMSGFFKREGNYALKVGRAVMLFAEHRKGEYEIHYLFPKDIRGADALSAAKQMVDYVFTKLRARTIFGKVPLSHMPSRVFSRALGALPICKCRDSLARPCIKYRIKREDWAI